MFPRSTFKTDHLAHRTTRPTSTALAVLVVSVALVWLFHLSPTEANGRCCARSKNTSDATLSVSIPTTGMRWKRSSKRPLRAAAPSQASRTECTKDGGQSHSSAPPLNLNSWPKAAYLTFPCLRRVMSSLLFCGSAGVLGGTIDTNLRARCLCSPFHTLLYLLLLSVAQRTTASLANIKIKLATARKTLYFPFFSSILSVQI